MILFSRMSAWIGFPIIFALFLGKWLDEKYSTTPWLFLLTIGLAFFISTFGIVKEGMTEIKKIEKVGKDKKENEEEKKDE